MALDPVTTAAILLGRQIVLDRAKRSGKGHATISLAQLAYASGNRDPRVVRLARGGNPTLDEALSSAAYYFPRLSTQAQTALNTALATGQVIPASAFGFTPYTESPNGPLTRTNAWAYAGAPPRRIVYGAQPPGTTFAGYAALDKTGAVAVPNVFYRAPDDSCQVVKPAYGWAETSGFPETVACLEKSAPNQLVPQMTNLGAPIPPRSVSPQVVARLRAMGKRFTPATDWPTLTRSISALKQRTEAAWRSVAWA